MKRMIAIEKKSKPEIIRIISFSYSDWGFTDKALPKLKDFLKKFEDEDITITNSSLVIRCIGGESRVRYELLLSDLQLLLTDTDFEGFKISTSEEMQSSY